MLLYHLEYTYVLMPLRFVFWLVSNYLQKRLHKIPGPFWRSISTLPRLFFVASGRSHDHDIALHRKYGPLVRVAPNTVSVSDPAAIHILYGLGTNFSKSPWYSLSTAYDKQGLIPDPFVLTDKPLHTRMKKNASNAYSLNGLVKMEAWIEPVTRRLFDLLDETAVGRTVDMAPILRNYAMDAVSALSFGDDMNYLRNGDADGFMKALDIFIAYTAVFGQVAWVHPLLLGNSYVPRLLFGSSSPDVGMVALAQAQVAKGLEKAEDGSPMTFVQQLLLNQRNDPAGATNREIMTHAFGNLTAGSDTTSTAMRSILFNVLKNPNVYEKLCKEVRTELRLPVKWAQAKDLPYLSAVIREGIKIHPSVGMMLGRTVPQEGATVCLYHFEPGVEVGINPWVLHRDPQVYPDPDRFWPERWLPDVSNEEQLKVMNRSFLAFGHGAHTCSGRWISIMETQKLIPSLLLRFDMVLADQGAAYKFKNLWFTQQTGLNVMLTKRDAQHVDT